MLSLSQVDTYLGARLFCKGFISVDSDLCDQETTTIRDISTIVKGELDLNNCMHAYTCYCSLSKKLTWFLHTKYTQIKKTPDLHIGLIHSKAMHGALNQCCCHIRRLSFNLTGNSRYINKTEGGVSALPEPGGPNLPCHPGIRNPSYLSIRRKFLFHS